MRRYAAATGLLSLVLAAPVAAGVAPAAATGSGSSGPMTSGPQAFHGFLLASGVSGQREVVASAVVGHGVFNGVGRIVEVASRPGDPDAVSRDDLVFRAGTMHIVNRNLHVSLHVNRQACRLTADIPQRSRVTGGTGRFADATGTFHAHVHATAKLARTPDGRCDMQAPPKRELDFISAHGRLSY